MKKIVILIILTMHGLFAVAHTSADSSANKKEVILEIGYYDSGTEQGGSTTMTITRDKILFQEDSSINQTEKNNDINWIKLLSTVDLLKFDKIVSAESVAAVDGSDTKIYIQTSKKKYSKFINYGNYKPIKKMLTELLKELHHFDNNFNVNYYQ